MAGSAVIGALRVNLGLDSAAFDKGLQGAQGTLSKVGQMMKTAFVAAAAAAVAAIAGIGVAIRGIINDADELSKTAAKIGIPIEELSRLKYAADLSGVAMGQLQTGVQRLSRNMSDAAAGTGEGAKAFKQLGINVKGADGSLKSATDIMGEIGDKFATMPDGAQKTALAMQLMGRSGADMIPFLNGGSAALKELTDEADAFGLTISAETGKRAEAFNDNISRIGYAAQGVTTALASALLPALVVVSEALVAAARGLVEMLTYLPTVAEYAAVAGGSLALMISPQIIAAIYGAATALGTALVGALRAVAVAAAANPLGALVVGLTVAITAVYHFRDEIKQAIGVDVVGVFKAGANAIIGAMVGAFEAIMATWRQFPAAMGDIAYQAADAFVRGIQNMGRTAIAEVNGVIASINGTLRDAGIAIPMLDAPINILPPSMDGVSNPYAGAAAGAAGAASAAFAGAQKDYVGAIASSFDSATESAQSFTRSAEEAAAAVGGSEAGGGSGGGKGGGLAGAGKKAADAWKGLRKETDASKDSLSSLGQIGQNISQTISSSFKGLIDGSKKLKDVLADVLSSLGDMLLNQGFQALMGGGSGGGGGLIGSLLGGLFGGFRAAGGPVSSSKAYVVGENGPELFAPGRSGSIIANENIGAGGGGSIHVTVGVDADSSGNLMPFVTSVSRREAQTASQSAMQQSARQFPQLQQDRQRRTG
ncbi:MAG: putative tail length tape measure protein [Prokaryotic dsDNA virus sp.]|nr:MAG: putative tail length tape measure protein [Prokaryotic dsDNA virus sp.]|tara:strand:- start:6021 stop:8144 length:2124 start_codon:yes stop_codon:yes gene_type:complete